MDSCFGGLEDGLVFAFLFCFVGVLEWVGFYLLDDERSWILYHAIPRTV